MTLFIIDWNVLILTRVYMS